MSAVEEYVEHFRARVLQDALNEGLSRHWLRRAEDFENARPRLDDFHGEATTDQLRAKWHELTLVANACRARAQVAPLDDIHPDVENVWNEAA